MNVRGLSIAGLVALALVVLPGCPQAAPMENEVTWGIKAATNQLTSTTPREWQAVADKVDELVPEADISLTDEQAQAVVDFVQANDLNSVQEIVDLVEQVQADPSTVNDLVIPDSVMELFGDYDFQGAIEGFVNGMGA